MAQLELNGLQVLILSILVLWAGVALTIRLPALQRLNLPPAVTGGVACAVLLALLELVGALQVQFELALRDELLLLFFATFGLILGGCVGGPLANNLIRSHGLETPGTGKGWCRSS